MKTVFNIMRFIIILVLGIIIFINLFFMYNQMLVFDKYPTLFGYGKIAISNTKYSVGYDNNDFIITKEDEYKIGDSVAFITIDGNVIIDTITDISGGRYYFTVDATSLILQSSIKGKVYSVMHNMGNIMKIIESPSGTIVMLIFILIVFELPGVVEQIKQRRNPA